MCLYQQVLRVEEAAELAVLRAEAVQATAAVHTAVVLIPAAPALVQAAHVHVLVPVREAAEQAVQQRTFTIQSLNSNSLK